MVTRCPRRACSSLSAPTTSARPPTLASGAASLARWAMVRRSALIRDAWATSRLDRDFAQVLGRVLGGRGVDVEARADLEAGDARQLGHDLDVPVVVLELALAHRRGVDHEVVGRTVERAVQALERVLEHLGQVLEVGGI